jgi:hypothetical protein
LAEVSGSSRSTDPSGRLFVFYLEMSKNKQVPEMEAQVFYIAITACASQKALTA